MNWPFKLRKEYILLRLHKSAEWPQIYNIHYVASDASVGHTVVVTKYPGFVLNTHINLTLRLLMSYIYIYIYIYGPPILYVSRSHTTTHHSR